MNETNAVLAGLRRHEPAALAAYLESYKAPLLSFLEQRIGAVLRGKLQASDLFQELSLKALRELPQTDLRDRDPFCWLCHLGEQCVIDGHRHFSAGKRASGREVSGNSPIGTGSQDLIAMISASMTTPTQAVVRNERERRLAEAMAALPDEHREALRLRYVEGLATKEVAARLSKSDAAVRVLLTRLIQKLQEMLGPAEGS